MWVNNFVASEKKYITENDVLTIHELILKNIDTPNAGIYRSTAVRIVGSKVILPSYTKINQLMSDFIMWLNQDTQNCVDKAIEAHID